MISPLNYSAKMAQMEALVHAALPSVVKEVRSLIAAYVPSPFFAHLEFQKFAEESGKNGDKANLVPHVKNGSECGHLTLVSGAIPRLFFSHMMPKQVHGARVPAAENGWEIMAIARDHTGSKMVVHQRRPPPTRRAFKVTLYEYPALRPLGSLEYASDGPPESAFNGEAFVMMTRLIKKTKGHVKTYFNLRIFEMSAGGSEIRQIGFHINREVLESIPIAVSEASIVVRIKSSLYIQIRSA